MEMDELNFQRNISCFKTEFRDYLETTLYSDLQLYCADGCIYLHQLILGSASGMLKQALVNLVYINGQDYEGATILLPDFFVADIEALLPYLYGGKHPQDPVVPLNSELLSCLGIDGNWERIYYPVMEDPVACKAEVDDQLNKRSYSLMYDWNHKSSLGDGCMTLSSKPPTDFDFDYLDANKFIGHNADSFDEDMIRMQFGMEKYFERINRGWMCTLCQDVVSKESDTVKHFNIHHYSHGVVVKDEKYEEEEEQDEDEDTFKPKRRRWKWRRRGAIYNDDGSLKALPPNHEDDSDDDDEGCEEDFRPFDINNRVAALKPLNENGFGKGKPGRRPVMRRVKYGWQCIDCESVFKTRSKFRLHWNVIHKDIANSTYECNECGRTFGYEKRYLAHLKTHRINQKGEKIEMYMCDRCDSVFKKKGALTDHMQRHDPPKYQCAKCPRQFKTKRGFRYHNDAHDGIADFLCTDCGIGFRNNEKLKHHRRVKHTFERPYVCKDCGEGFYRSDKLLSHRRRAHTGERPYRCDFCDWRGYDCSNLIQHRKKHYNGDSLKLDTITTDNFVVDSVGMPKTGDTDDLETEEAVADIMSEMQEYEEVYETRSKSGEGELLTTIRSTRDHQDHPSTSSPSMPIFVVRSKRTTTNH